MFEFLRSIIKNVPILNRVARIIYVSSVDLLERDEISRTKVNPYSELEDNYKVIFIHIPKNAGNGVAMSLFDRQPSGHNFITLYRDYDNKKYNSYFSFCFCRCPYDRLYSAYTYLRQGGFGIYDKEFSEKYLSKFTSFQEFVLELKNDQFSKLITRWCHFIPQYKFACDENENLLVQYVARYEKIDEEMDFLRKKLHLLSKENKVVNRSKKSNVIDIYTPEMREIVHSVYYKDFEIFGYQKQSLH
ncbi:sulfotransferase family protein [Endozoicomonas sp. SESOKO1]|uniref:sulfotransferase family protein n=1 Tax=Endozoicomonas sp. SESOKO1 TaxID=2828742 RepID=UPI0021497EE5|nr:sulfotransferase family protein [Endozoicomonas sp. SESOKO1]